MKPTRLLTISLLISISAQSAVIRILKSPDVNLQVVIPENQVVKLPLAGSKWDCSAGQTIQRPNSKKENVLITCYYEGAAHVGTQVFRECDDNPLSMELTEADKNWGLWVLCNPLKK